MNDDANSGLTEVKCLPLDSPTLLPCGDCEREIKRSEAAGFVIAGQRIAPLCAGCFQRGMADPEHAQLVERATRLGYSLRAIRKLFERDGLALPVTAEECRRASTVLHGLDALAAGKTVGPAQ